MASDSVWRPLRDELDRWARAGARPRFWMRDDDACAVTPALRRLAELAEKFRVQIGLAAIPGRIEDGLVDYCRKAEPQFFPMCHGWMHENYGPHGRPGEFGPDRPIEALEADARSAIAAFGAHFGTLPVVFVPPFGRITDDLVRRLTRIGYGAVSTGPTDRERRLARAFSSVPWLPAAAAAERTAPPHLDVHIDLIDWRTRTARPASVVAREIVGYLRMRRKNVAPQRSPIGILAHHLAHDQAIWELGDALFGVLADHGGVDIAGAADYARAAAAS